MSLSSDLPKVISKLSQDRRDDEALARLREFYAQMLKEGIAVKKPYDLPQLDTIGRTAHQVKSN